MYTAVMTKSDLIRQQLELDPQMKPAAIRAALAEQRVHVELNHIKVVRHRWRQEQKRRVKEKLKLDLPVGGRPTKKSEAEIEADVDRMLDLLDSKYTKHRVP